MHELTLEGAIRFACVAHEGQFDKLNQPYVLHPLAVMMTVPEYLRIPALFHDIIEDTDFTLDDLRELGVSARDVEIIDYLTKRKGESRADYINRVMEDPDAILVKRADRRHNMSRIEFIDDPATRNRLEKKYQRDMIQMNVPEV
jgi:(p)ppGpp synthase/HD superfamily hydrolase